VFIWKTGKNQEKPVWIKIQNAMQTPDYYSTMVIQELIKKPQFLCTLVRYKHTMDAFNLSLYQRSNYNTMQCCYSLPCGCMPWMSLQVACCLKYYADEGWQARQYHFMIKSTLPTELSWTWNYSERSGLYFFTA